MGMAIALSLTFYSVVICKNSIQFDHFLHLLGIIITFVLIIYSSSPGDSFPFILRIIRSFRLFFIMNANFHFSDLFQIYMHKFQRILKVLVPWIFITLLFSLIMYQSTYYQYYNRCSLIV
jgi:nucleoside permease NupC